MLASITLAAVIAVAAAAYEVTPNGEKCAGAPGKPYFKYVPCGRGHECVAKPSYAYGEWGKFCLPAGSYAKQCYAKGARCMGAPGKDYVLWKPCCDRGYECYENESLGWGSFCQAVGGAYDLHDHEPETMPAFKPDHDMWHSPEEKKKVVYPAYHWGKHTVVEKKRDVFVEAKKPAVVEKRPVAMAPVTKAPVVAAVTAAPVVSVTAALVAAVTAAPVVVVTAAPIVTVVDVATAPAVVSVADDTADATDEDAETTDEPTVRMLWGQ